MAPKKSKPNAFVLFAQDLLKQPGRKYNSLSEACLAAGPLWHNLPKDDRKTYEERARGMRGQNVRYTSEGRVVEELIQEEEHKKQAEENARREIYNIIQTAGQKKVLDVETFFLIHVNIFCYYSNEDRFWPAEISVMSFNLKEGVKQENVFHHMVHSGPLPIGYKHEAKQHSDETHLIKVPFEDVDDNQEEVYFKLKTFLQKKSPKGSSHMPILYALDKNCKMIHNILNSWAQCYDEEPETFKVHNLQTMFHYLRNKVAGKEVWQTTAFSHRELEKDVYAYVCELACEYHATTSKPFYCSKSAVQRYAYVICDNCCADLQIDYIEGQHVPILSAIPDLTSNYGSSVSGRSSRSTRSRRREKFGDDYETASDTWDTCSTVSNSSTFTLASNLDDNFPILGQNRPQSQMSSASSISMAKSYAGATSKNNWSQGLEQRMAELSLLSSGNASGSGKDMRTCEVNSNSSSLAGNRRSDMDFPPMARGRGFRRPEPKRPGPEGEKA